MREKNRRKNKREKGPPGGHTLRSFWLLSHTGPTAELRNVIGACPWIGPEDSQIGGRSVFAGRWSLVAGRWSLVPPKPRVCLSDG